jgi:hypothetical protein
VLLWLSFSVHALGHFGGRSSLRIIGIGSLDSRSLRYDSHVRMHHFVRRSTYVPFRWFFWMCNVFLPLFMVLWVHIFAMLCRRAVLMLWHAFMFLGLSPVGLFPLFQPLLAWFPILFLVKNILINEMYHPSRPLLGISGEGVRCSIIIHVHVSSSASRLPSDGSHLT